MATQELGDIGHIVGGGTIDRRSIGGHRAMLGHSDAVYHKGLGRIGHQRRPDTTLDYVNVVGRGRDGMGLGHEHRRIRQ